MARRLRRRRRHDRATETATDFVGRCGRCRGSGCSAARRNPSTSRHSRPIGPRRFSLTLSRRGCSCPRHGRASAEVTAAGPKRSATGTDAAPREGRRPAPSGAKGRPRSATRPAPAAHTATSGSSWVVRGHWRQQAHGPGRSLRHTTGYRATSKGPEGAAPRLRDRLRGGADGTARLDRDHQPRDDRLVVGGPQGRDDIDGDPPAHLVR